ncbi:hemerythrin domain-containing protein [Hoyosella sp. YIM 151337]|uniref:hemerythrin domain-containing protein n=1 Tax=Hoyosella sp. YIM 151337 TaxID=2992742 RepID=UPI002235E842|nr:hemerythrin domain-containing protein [Hoyosella sp. YIM 151337]MCW4351840.1 hemerythrin domain-containing protein [Hoyosella sp. YIM 151337]
MSEQQRDVIEILMHDHRAVEEMFSELESLPNTRDNATRRKTLADKVIIELVRHSVAEETEVYPAVKEKVSAEEAERAKHEHAEAEETMHILDSLDADDPDFDAQLVLLMREVRAHVAEEENEIFPHMRQIFSPAELVELGRRVERVKGKAPTRPHPSAPDEPPANRLAGPATGLLDRLRDSLTGRGRD